jgi:hypothetical protein
MKTNIHFLSYVALFSLELETFQTKTVEKNETRFMFSNFFFENRAVYEIMWRKTVESDRPQAAIWRMRILCWIPKATNTLSEYVILLLSQCNKRCTNTPRG